MPVRGHTAAIATLGHGLSGLMVAPHNAWCLYCGVWSSATSPPPSTPLIPSKSRLPSTVLAAERGRGGS